VKVLLVNLLAALNFADVFLKNKKAWKFIKNDLKIIKNVKNVKKRDQNKKRKQRFFTSVVFLALAMLLFRMRH